MRTLTPGTTGGDFFRPYARKGMTHGVERSVSLQKAVRCQSVQPTLLFSPFSPRISLKMQGLTPLQKQPARRTRASWDLINSRQLI